MKTCLFSFATALLLSKINVNFASDYFEYDKEDNFLANSFLKDRNKFHEYILNNPHLNRALNFLSKGQRYYFKGNDVFEAAGDSQGRCRVIYDYISKTKSIVVFSSNFHSTANAYFQQGRQVVVGDWKGKNIISFHENIIWISERYRGIPAIIAMLIAHEVGHGLYREYKSNKNVFPGEPGDVPENQNEVCDDLLTEKSVEEYIAYAREGAIVDELHLSSLFDALCIATVYDAMTPKAKEKFHELFGEMKPRSFEQWKTQINYHSDVRRCFRGYSSKKRKCGMPCKYFKEYKLCDNQVAFPPCHLWAKHLESLQEK